MSDTATTQPAPRRVARPEIPHPSFNFIGEVWDRKQSARKTNLLMFLAAVVVVAATAGLGMWLGSGNTALERRRDEANIAASQAENQIKERTGGVEDLPRHLADRRTAVTSALTNDIDTRIVLGELFSATPANVRLVSVSIEHRAASTAAPSKDDPDTENAEPATEDDASAPSSAVMTVLAMGEDSSAGMNWRDSLRLVALFNPADPLVVNNDGQLTATLSIDLSAVQTQLANAEHMIGDVGGAATSSEDSDESVETEGE